ncbi:MAG: 16S rRNA (cytosine(1402)-N(4))-methyltransferase RsmH [Candidatus Omnitrophica bacterium]|nr:16S rRNA (cytosine(1402)-N(4))-methyltransferase RsmH [Candidatus Omnitrophota bacterium]
MKNTDYYHKPVLAQAVLDILEPRPSQVIVDCTVGLGGHAEAIAERIGPDGMLVGLDKDVETLEQARMRLEPFAMNVRLVHEDFRNLALIKERLRLTTIDAILFDLGLSSHQLSRSERGFSFMREGTLDMRFDRSQGLTAQEVVNTFDERALEKCFREYSEERHASRIAAMLVTERKKHPIETTTQLADIAYRSLGRFYRKRRIHPATKVFQALRILVNDELTGLSLALEGARESISPGGKICIIAFHSLEDRMVKNAFRAWLSDGSFKSITKKPIRPAIHEIQENPRSRSAKLRAVEKIYCN